MSQNSINPSSNPSSVLLDYPQERIISMMYESQIGDFVESSYVAKSVICTLRSTTDIIPQITKHQGFDLASRCLVSLGFFRDYMTHLTNNHGYPSPDFYVLVGKKTFIQEGRKDISLHFESWMSFLHESFSKEVAKNFLISPSSTENQKHNVTFQDHRQWKAPGFLERGYNLGNFD